MSTSLLLKINDQVALARLQTRVLEQSDVVHRIEHENVIRRLCIGLALTIIKESLKHGEFLPWLKEGPARAAGYTNCTYMMRLAREWLDASKQARTEAAALPAADFTLDTKDATMGRLVASAEKFVGSKSWTELLQKYGIRETARLGGAREAGEEGEATPQDAEQLYLFTRDELGNWLGHGETLFLKENRLQHLVGHPEEIRGVVHGLRALADKIEAAAEPLLEKAS